jgi:hypothetical protein
MKRIFTILAAVLLTGSVFAQSPQKMSYQAVIRNSSNLLVVNHSVGMKISILQGTATGTAVYFETQTPTTNANGLISIEIGGGNGFDTIHWANNYYFIKTETDPTGGTNYTITGTSQLLSVPYALHSKTAESISGGIPETDPVFVSSAANGISSTNITNWNSAFGWGNHGTAGYLTSFTETDPHWSASPSFGITGTYITNWNTAYGWGNHASAGYLTSFTESDPIFAASIASKITTTDTMHWNHKFDLPLLSTGSVLFSNGTTLVADNKLFWDNTNKYLGVGTNTPNAYLDVKSQNPSLSSSILRILNNNNDSVLTVSGKGANMFIDSTSGSFNVKLLNGTPRKRLMAITPLNYFIGYESGVNITTGNYNYFAGYEAGKSCMNGSQNILIGNSAGSAITTGSENVCIGTQTALSNLNGNNNLILGFQAGYSNSGSGNVFLGNKAGYAENGSNLLYIDNSNNPSPLIWGSFGNRRVVINGSGINNINNRTFFVNGSSGGTGAWWNDSDEKLKKNIKTIESPLKKVLALRGVNYEWKDTTNHDKGLQIGFIAQETVKILPEVVSNNGGTYAMQYAPITALLVEAVKEQQKKIDDLELLNNRIKQLEEQNKKLANDLELIKQQLKMKNN